MARTYQFFLPLLSLFLVRVDLTDLYPIKIPVRLMKIVDGDTVQVKSSNRRFTVRLSKVDSPEKGQPFIGSRRGDAGKVALICLKRLLAGHKTMTLRLEGFDVYGRMLGDLDRVSLRIIESGCAGLYPYATFSSKEEKTHYLFALQKAKNLKRGLWAFGGYDLPKIWRKKNRSFSRKRIAHLRSRR